MCGFWRPALRVCTLALAQVLVECQAQGDKLVVFSEMLDNLGEVETILQQEYGWAEGREYLRCSVKLWSSCTCFILFVLPSRGPRRRHLPAHWAAALCADRLFVKLTCISATRVAHVQTPAAAGCA
jgi:hypothetical protein